MKTKPPQTSLAVVTGATASGKSALGILLARALREKGRPCEIVCCDSMLVYRDLDIGTDKPSTALQKEIPHHCLDLARPEEVFNVGDYVAAARAAIAGIEGRGHLPLLIGGTGLYLRALTQGLLPIAPASSAAIQDFTTKTNCALEAGASLVALYAQLQKIDKEGARRIHPNDKVRIVRALAVAEVVGKPLSALQSAHGFRESPYRSVMLAIDWPRRELYGRIDARLERMVERGLMEEVKRVLATGVSTEARSLQGLAYRYFVQAARDEITTERALALTQRDSRRFAKRQLTWFRPLAGLHWLPGKADMEGLVEPSLTLLKGTIAELR